MHKIHFGDRRIVICHPDDSPIRDDGAILFKPGETFSLEDVIRYFECPGSIPEVYVPAEDCEQAYRSICALFKEVNAAGGLVSDGDGNYLLISRNGLWDLPKGHQEPGEDIQVTATREVQEETGLEDLVEGDLICITDHCYFRDGMWHLKHTWWYAMTAGSRSGLKPQMEEGITKAEWIGKSDLPPCLENTYPSIIEVFRKAEV